MTTGNNLWTRLTHNIPPKKLLLLGGEIYSGYLVNNANKNYQSALGKLDLKKGDISWW